MSDIESLRPILHNDDGDAVGDGDWMLHIVADPNHEAHHYLRSNVRDGVREALTVALADRLDLYCQEDRASTSSIDRWVAQGVSSETPNGDLIIALRGDEAAQMWSEAMCRVVLACAWRSCERRWDVQEARRRSRSSRPPAYEDDARPWGQLFEASRVLLRGDIPGGQRAIQSLTRVDQTYMRGRDVWHVWRRVMAEALIDLWIGNGEEMP